MAKSIKKCDGMRKDGTCGNGMNVENHNKPCIGSKCPHRFLYGHETEAAEQTSAVVAMSYKDRVSAQYQTVCEKTSEFFREVVKFGALLNEVESFIGEGRGRGNEGEGLMGWLAENCPEINYKTAVGYKSMAAKCAKMIGGGVQALACLQGQDKVIEPTSKMVVDVDATFIEKRDALFDQVESRRQLEQMWFEFNGTVKKAGRPAGSGAKAGPYETSGLAKLTDANVLEAVFLDLTKIKILLDKHRKTMAKYAPALKVKHPNECEDFAAVAKDFWMCFK